MMQIHINRPRIDKKRLSHGKCPDCKRHVFFMWFYQEWYGWDITCLRCGRSFGDGEWLPLTFSRTARQDSIGSAKRRWRQNENKNSDNKIC